MAHVARVMGLLEQLGDLDMKGFLAINGAGSAALDTIMSGASEMFLWFPLYVFFLYVLQRRYGWRGLLFTVPILALMILMSDKGSVMLFKEHFQRLRPCHEPALQGLVRLVPDGCGGQYGFVSSHASNHFAIAVFMIGALRGVPRWAAPALLAWAGFIAYSRVYLGVHYPGDVIIGGLYGAFIALLCLLLHRWTMHRMTIRT